MEELIELSKRERREYHKRMQKMVELIRQTREAALLIEAVTVYLTRTYALHWEDGISWDKYKEQSGYSKATLCRYLNAATVIDSWARECYSATENEAFFLSNEMVDQFIRYRQKNHLPFTINALYDESKKVDNPESEPTAKEQNLFSVHDKITGAGYKFDNGKYVSSDNEEITSEQYAEFVSEAEGLKLFDETDKLLENFHKDFTVKATQLRKDFLAYATRNQSPKTKKTIEARNKEIEQKLASILHEITTVLKP